MKKIVFATQNKGKLREIRQIFADLPYEICCMGDLGLDLDIEENGTTYEENAMIKAEALFKALKSCKMTKQEETPLQALTDREEGKAEALSPVTCSGGNCENGAKNISPDDYIVMSDDSGFEVDYLGGEPGIYSARYMGTETSYDIKNQSILDKLAGVPDEKRTARFKCAIACILPDGTKKVVCEAYEGLVAHEAKGTYGFGYDPIFYVPMFGCNDAELLPEVKNTVSHRAKALNKMRELLKQLG